MSKTIMNYLNQGSPIYKKFCHYMAALGPFEEKPVVAIGLSGGKDSLALACLLNTWVSERGGKLIALTVDHGLRVESREEAVWVQEWCLSQNIEHHILTGQLTSNIQNIQKYARLLRYNLMSEWCQNQGIFHLCIAHHLQDQVETFWLRLERGSGVEGLASMPIVTEKTYCRIIRPLLFFSVDELKTLLQSFHQEWLNDPSNKNTQYRRNYWRAIFEKHTPCETDSNKKIYTTSINIAQSCTFLDHETDLMLAKYVCVYNEGYLSVSKDIFSLHDEIIYRVLRRCLMSMKGDFYPPRQESLFRMIGLLLKGKTQTLARCKFYNRKREVLIAREFSTIKRESFTEGLHWDSRFHLFAQKKRNIDIPLHFYKVLPLGQERWSVIKASHPNIVNHNIPSQVYWCLPRILLDPTLGVDEYECVPYLSKYKDVSDKHADFKMAFGLVPQLGVASVLRNAMAFKK